MKMARPGWTRTGHRIQEMAVLRRQRLKPPQTIRGVNGASNEVPFGVERRDICAESDGLRPSLASGQRVNVPQTIRGVNGASNEVPLGTSSVVMFAAMPPGVPKNDNCADPETEVAQVPTPLI